MQFKIDIQAQNIDYTTFASLNDLCFPHEPISEYEYQVYLSKNIWSVYHLDNFIGFSVMTTGKYKAHINRIGIHPNFRSMGLGTDLMKAMITKSIALGLDQISLLVQQDNAGAIKFYKNFVFVVTGESVQFSVPILPGDVEDFSISSIDDYTKTKGTLFPQQKMTYLIDRHHPPHSYSLVFHHQDRAVGYTCFSPDFPGCYPFEIFGYVDELRQLVSLLDIYAHPDKKMIKITTQNPTVIELFEAVDTRENYRLFEMSKTLT